MIWDFIHISIFKWRTQPCDPLMLIGDLTHVAQNENFLSHKWVVVYLEKLGH